MLHSTARTLGVIASLALAGSLAACAPPAAGEGAAEGSTLVLGMVGSSKDEVQPYADQNSISSGAVYEQLYDGLASFDNTGAVQMDLAESMTPNATLDVWTVKLRPGVTLHNGEAFTADDVIESVEYIIDPDNAFAPSTQLAFLDPNGLKKIDDLTIEMTLTKPYGPFAEAWAADRLNMRSLTDDPAAPEGTGPFVLDSFTAGQEATFTRFDDYWGEKPGFEKLKIVFFNDQQAITNALRGGQIDVAYSVPFTDVATLTAEKGIETVVSDSAGYLLLEMRTDIAPFDDPRVREAMRLIANRQQIVDNAYGGYATVANDFIGNNTACTPPDVPQREQDIARATELLAEAGQSDLEVELVTDGAFPGMLETAQLYAQQAEEAGVTVTVRHLDVATFLNQWLEWPFMVGYTSSPYLVTATNHFTPGGEENATHMDDPEYNELAAELYATADADAQCAIVTQLQQIEYERGGDIVPTYSQIVTAHRDTVAGLQPDLYGRTSFEYAGVTVSK